MTAWDLQRYIPATVTNALHCGERGVAGQLYAGSFTSNSTGWEQAQAASKEWATAVAQQACTCCRKSIICRIQVRMLCVCLVCQARPLLSSSRWNQHRWYDQNQAFRRIVAHPIVDGRQGVACNAAPPGRQSSTQACVVFKIDAKPGKGVPVTGYCACSQ